MKIQDPFGFAKAIQVPKDKKAIDRVHKLLFKKKMKKKIKKEIQRSMATEVAYSDTIDIDAETNLF